MKKKLYLTSLIDFRSKNLVGQKFYIRLMRKVNDISYQIEPKNRLESKIKARPNNAA